MIVIKKSVWGFKYQVIYSEPMPNFVPDADFVTYISSRVPLVTDLDEFVVEESLTSVVDLKQDLNVIYNGFEKKFVRRQILRGEKKGIKIVRSTDYETFYKLNKEFRKEKGLSGSESLEVIKNGTLFLAFLGETLLSGSVFLEDEELMRYWLSASNRFENDKETVGQSTRMILWEAIKYAKEKGITTFDMGGICEDPNDKEKYSISRFKKSFGGTTIKMYAYTKYYSWILKLIKKVKK